MTHIVDANAHVMAADVGGAVASLGEARDPHEATAEELLAYMRQAGVHQAVIVPHPPGSSDNSYCIEAAQRYPESFVAIGKIDVADPEAVARLNQLVEEPGIGGLRFELRDGRDPSEWLEAPEIIPLWEGAARRPVSVYCHPSAGRTSYRPFGECSNASRPSRWSFCTAWPRSLSRTAPPINKRAISSR